MKKIRIKRADVYKAILSLVLLVIAALWILPLVMTILTSFKSTLEVKKFVKYHNLLPIEWVTINYEDVFHNNGLPLVNVFGNTFIVCGICIIGQLYGTKGVSLNTHIYHSS